ncbi:hypothetical protein Micbo1qcDRAFT_176253 [Microdochium bolleyi]|uniref:Secreted protein n=1 Tax=Microdochium bolleyi TaxID=196109 RepID=A0A136IZT7_9PEZI|nr:hypothetical protein Micbo1qcDRAFT_176253 [Microdochium bolleyi]
MWLARLALSSGPAFCSGVLVGDPALPCAANTDGIVTMRLGEDSENRELPIVLLKHDMSLAPAGTTSPLRIQWWRLRFVRVPMWFGLVAEIARQGTWPWSIALGTSDMETDPGRSGRPCREHLFW